MTTEVTTLSLSSGDGNMVVTASNDRGFDGKRGPPWEGVPVDDLILGFSLPSSSPSLFRLAMNLL